MEVLLTSTLLICVILLLRRLLRGRISLRLQYALWILVVLRLMVPFNTFQSPASVLNAVDPAPVVQALDSVSIPLARPQVQNPAPAEPGETDPAPDTGTSLPADTAPSGGAALSLMELLRALWLAGALAVGGWLLCSNLLFLRRLRRERVACPELSGPLPVYRVDSLSSPCLFGLFRPAVYVTGAAFASEARLQHVLLHELCHYAHGDQWWSLLRAVCLAAYWFNPFVWLAAVFSRRDCELACDEAALRELGEENRESYGRTLLAMVHRGSAPRDLLSTATTMSSGKRALRERIVFIARRPKMLVSTLALVLALTLVLVSCTFTGGTPQGSGTQSPDPSSSASPDPSGDTPDPGGSAEPTPEASLNPQNLYYILNDRPLGAWKNGWQSVADADMGAKAGLTLQEFLSPEQYHLYSQGASLSDSSRATIYTEAGPSGFPDAADYTDELSPYSEPVEGLLGFRLFSLPVSLPQELRAIPYPGTFQLSQSGEKPVFSTNGSHNALPRPYTVENEPSDQGREHLVRLLAEWNIPDAPLNFTQTVRGDFDGDGEEELLMLASTPVDESGWPVFTDSELAGKSGSFTVAMLQKGQEVQVLYSESNPITETRQPGSIDHCYRLSFLGAYDLNGDGQMELCMHYQGWEWSYELAYALTDGAYRMVLNSGY